MIYLFITLILLVPFFVIYLHKEVSQVLLKDFCVEKFNLVGIHRTLKQTYYFSSYPEAKNLLYGKWPESINRNMTSSFAKHFFNNATLLN